MKKLEKRKVQQKNHGAIGHYTCATNLYCWQASDAPDDLFDNERMSLSLRWNLSRSGISVPGWNVRIDERKQQQDKGKGWDIHHSVNTTYSCVGGGTGEEKMPKMAC
jgi:hypothetical protein